MLDFSQVATADLANLEAKTRVLLPEGTYSARVIDIKCDFKFRNTTTEGVVIEYAIEGGQHDGETITDFLITRSKDGKDLPGGYAKIKARLMAYGYTAEQISKFKPPKDGKGFGDFKHAIDREVSLLLKVKTDKNDGKTRNEIVSVVPRGTEPYSSWPNPKKTE